jgi:SAM-dependent methyltransferase
MSNHQQFRRYVEGFWAVWLVHVGTELGLFRELEHHHVQPEALAERLGFELPYTMVWCKAAQAYGFLEWADHEGYRVAPGWGPVVFGNGPWSSTYIRLSQQVNQSLEAVFRGRALPESSLSLRLHLSDGLRQSYHWIWDELVAQVPPLHERLENECRLVEFGCGIGLGLEMAKDRFPQLELTGVEPDFECAREAERTTRAVVVVERLQDFQSQAQFDVVLFNRALATCEEPRRAIDRAIECLKPGGFLIICSDAEIPGGPDVFPESARLRLGERFFYQMFITSDALRNLALSEIERWCRDECLETVFRDDHGEQGSPTLILYKPNEF